MRRVRWEWVGLDRVASSRAGLLYIVRAHASVECVAHPRQKKHGVCVGGMFPNSGTSGKHERSPPGTRQPDMGLPGSSVAV